MTLRDALAEACTQIARRDAETLLAHLLEHERTWVFAHPEAGLSAEQAVEFRTLVARRLAHEPLQHLTGRQEFYGLTLQVTADTLIPRPETELLVEAVLAWAANQSRALRIVDVGTGSGAIALALATHLPGAEIVAGDLSEAALEVARQNAEFLGLGERVRFVRSDLLAGFEAEIDAGDLFDLVVSNPPYVPESDAGTMQREVVEYEPAMALFGGEDGLTIYRELIPAAHVALRPGGLLAMEFGFGQLEALRALLLEWDGVAFLDDYAGIPRIALATRRT
jgi:release factor glutamine methyltransferase